jgi:hypothetical protein
MREEKEKEKEKEKVKRGRRVHQSTIARWHAQESRPVAHSWHPLEAA